VSDHQAEAPVSPSVAVATVARAWGPGEVEPGHRHARDHERHPCEHRVLPGEQQLDDAVRVADPGQRVHGDDGVGPGVLVDGPAYRVERLGHDQRARRRDDGERHGPQPVQRQDREEDQGVEGEDHVDIGVQGREGETEGEQDDRADDDSAHGLPARPPGPRTRATGDENEREAREQGEERGGTAAGQFQDEAEGAAHGGVRSDMGGVHAEDREAPGQVHADEPTCR
jgi:hypothetical protein